MSENERPIDWSKTTFGGARREQLRQAQRTTARQRLEELGQLTELSGSLQNMARQVAAPTKELGVHEPWRGYRSDSSCNDIVLGGCTPTPLANYLKALGVLRLLATRDPRVRGFWRGDRFMLRTALDRAAIDEFFLHDYEPTPVMAPWNGGSGFYFQERKSKAKDPVTGKRKKLGIYDQETAATKIVDAVLSSKSKRLAAYRNALGHAKLAVRRAGFVTSPESGRQKDEFILSLRAALPDECIQAMDAGVAATCEKTSYPPMLGTGWNDGNLDFSSNFMQRLLDVLGTADGAPPRQSADWLYASLFGASAPNLTRNNIGQFFPGRAGGPNATTGFEADAAINPWDFVLMIEGVLSFAAAAVRRNADDPAGVLSYPFTVRAVGAGSGSLGEGDTANARGELWMPLWSNPATYAEIRALMAEGRVALGSKPARDALDFVRAVQHFGGYRGIKSFQRFGLLQRSGKAYLATPLSRVKVGNRLQPSWLDDLDRNHWLERFRQFARGDNTANRLLILRKRLEDQLFAVSGREPSKADAQSLLVLIGEIQFALSNSRKARETVRPVPSLSEQWVVAADDSTPAFRIAKALAGLRGVGEKLLPLRSQLFPMQRKCEQWMTSDANEKVRIYTGLRGRLIDTLRVLLDRRLWLTEKLEMGDKPLESAAGATLEDISAFLRDDSLDERIAALLPGLSLCDIPQDFERRGGSGAVPAAFALLKLSLTPDRILRSLGLLPGNNRLPLPVGLLAQLAAGNHDNHAVQTAWRRLRASGIAPTVSLDTLPGEDGLSPLRASAALLIPLEYGAAAVLARDVLEPHPRPETEIA